MLLVLGGNARPTMALAKVPVLVSGCHGHTSGPGPFADLMRRTKALERQPGVLSTSLFLVHPYLDLPDMGGGALVVTNDDPARAEALAVELACAYWDRRFDLEPPVFSPEAAIRLGEAVEGGPVLLIETADCIGGGAAGDSVTTLKALLNARVGGRAYAPVVDPAAAAACHAAGEGAEIVLKLGHGLVPEWGEPVKVRGRVLRLCSGEFEYEGGPWGGQQVTMGPSAVLEVGLVHVLITTLPTYDWADEQYRAAGCEVRTAKWVVVKNPMNYRMTYGPFARAMYLLDTPGPTPATLRHVRYRQLQRPYFPADTEIPDLRPAVAQSRAAH
jgi:microcystin degradation protein MlrC